MERRMRFRWETPSAASHPETLHCGTAGCLVTEEGATAPSIPPHLNETEIMYEIGVEGDRFHPHVREPACDTAGCVIAGFGGPSPSGAARSVLQDWVMELPLREQGTLLTAVRGCDVVPKYPLDSLPRRIVAAVRWSFMVPHDPREVDIPGAFFASEIPEPKELSGIGHLPQHWFSHVWHAVEVLGYRHPTPHIRVRWRAFYEAMCRDQHVNGETGRQMIDRLSEDRIASGSVVS